MLNATRLVGNSGGRKFGYLDVFDVIYGTSRETKRISVPAGVSVIRAKLWGSGGGGAGGGAGAFVMADLSVFPGDVLEISNDGGVVSSGGYPGGKFSYVKNVTTGEYLLIAAGGGGGGGQISAYGRFHYFFGGNGGATSGNAGGDSLYAPCAGAGGGLSGGGAGGQGYYQGYGSYAPLGSPGGQYTGGGGGAGGGAGLYGGGGGGIHDGIPYYANQYGGGGGGSSLVTGTNTFSSSGSNATTSAVSPYQVISYPAPYVSDTDRALVYVNSGAANSFGSVVIRI